MASTYNSTQLGGTALSPRNYPTPGVGEGGKTRHGNRGDYTLSAALVINDVINMFYLPKNARVTGGFLKSADLDSNVSPAVTLDVGDAGSATRYWSASTVGQAGGVDSTMAATGVDYLNTAKTLVIVTVHAAPATSATTGTIVLSISYTVEEE